MKCARGEQTESEKHMQSSRWVVEPDLNYILWLDKLDILPL